MISAPRFWKPCRAASISVDADETFDVACCPARPHQHPSPLLPDADAGTPQRNDHSFPGCRRCIPYRSRLDEEELSVAAELALGELLLSGCTAAADHHYLYPGGLEHAVDIEVAAARNLGMRLTVTRGSMNLSEKDGGLPPDSVVQHADTILADCERVLNAYHDKAAGAQVQVALAPCSPFSSRRT